jgi:hypothetical protein
MGVPLRSAFNGNATSSQGDLAILVVIEVAAGMRPGQKADTV